MQYQQSETETKRRAARIKLLILDVDGVLTNGSLLFHEDGRESKIFHVHDGHGIRLVQKAGIEVILLSGRSSPVVERRARELGIGWAIQGSQNKLAAYQEILRQRRLEDDDVAYVGDDVVDVPVMRKVGLAIAVADATAPALSHCHLVTQAQGGRGAVREVCDFLLEVQGKWQDVTAPYLAKTSD